MSPGCISITTLTLVSPVAFPCLQSVCSGILHADWLSAQARLTSSRWEPGQIFLHPPRKVKAHGFSVVLLHFLLRSQVENPNKTEPTKATNNDQFIYLLSQVDCRYSHVIFKYYNIFCLQCEGWWCIYTYLTCTINSHDHTYGQGGCDYACFCSVRKSEYLEKTCKEHANFMQKGPWPAFKLVISL